MREILFLFDLLSWYILSVLVGFFLLGVGVDETRAFTFGFVSSTWLGFSLIVIRGGCK